MRHGGGGKQMHWGAVYGLVWMMDGIWFRESGEVCWEGSGFVRMKFG